MGFPQFKNSNRKNPTYPPHPFWQMTWYVWVLLGIIILYAIIFQLLMIHVEGVRHSWFTAIYWTITVMSTLGFGDVVFESDIGKMFSMIVLTTGIIQIMVLLPVVFIRFGPWIERITRVRVPTAVPSSTTNHAIITCNSSQITLGLLAHLQSDGIPTYIIQPDKEEAARQYVDGLPVIVGEADTLETFKALKIHEARIVVVNDHDTINTNSILTIRELDANVPIVTIAHQEQSVDVLELSGATHVLPLKRWLGEQLADRVNAFHSRLSDIGVFGELNISEMAVGGSSLEGKTIAETKLRARTGVSIAGVWQGSQLKAARSDLTLQSNQVVVLIGTADQLKLLGSESSPMPMGPDPVLVIGGGRVGIAAAKRLTEKMMRVHIVEKNPNLQGVLSDACDEVHIGDAAEYRVLEKAGISKASAVVVTTNDDVVNIYLTSYCRHLNNRVRIVSRITHERNIDASHRAGSDLVLRYSSLGVEAVLAAMENRKMMVLGEYLQFYHVPTPESLYGKTLAESHIGSETGVIVLGVENENQLITNPSKDYTNSLGTWLTASHSL